MARYALIGPPTSHFSSGLILYNVTMCLSQGCKEKRPTLLIGEVNGGNIKRSHALKLSGPLPSNRVGHSPLKGSA